MSRPWFQQRLPISTRDRGFTLIRLSDAHLPESYFGLLIQRSRQRLLNAAAWTGLGPAPESRSQGAHPHLSRSWSTRSVVHCELSFRVLLQHTLNGWPIRSPTDASQLSSRATAHGSGTTWVATPSSQWTFTTYPLPVSRRTHIPFHRVLLHARQERCSTSSSTRLWLLKLVPYGPTLLACCVELQRRLNPIKS